MIYWYETKGAFVISKEAIASFSPSGRELLDKRWIKSRWLKKALKDEGALASIFHKFS